jgi:hypothetical protein
LAAAAHAQQAATDLLDSPYKVDSEPLLLHETVGCTLKLTQTSGLFGLDRIGGTNPTEFVAADLFSPFVVYRLDEHCSLLGTWTTAFPVPGSTQQTGITVDEAAGGDRYWVCDAFGTGSIVQFEMGTGIATGLSQPFPSGFPGTWGPAAIDNNRPGKLCFVEEIAVDLIVEIDLDSGALGCSFMNPDNTGAGAFGNGLSDAADPSYCEGATLVVSSGTDAEGRVTRASQMGCSPAMCYGTWDIATPLSNTNEDWVNGIEEYVSASRAERRLMVLGNATGTAFDLGNASLRLGACQGRDSPDSDVLFVNAERGGTDYTIGIDNTRPLGLAIQKPCPFPLGNGRFVLHMNEGPPVQESIVTLPSQLGDACFPFLIPPYGRAAPVAVWNNIGKTRQVGGTMYFFTPMDDPDRAPTFLDDPQGGCLAGGDPLNLPVGSQWTLQGLILSPCASSPSGASVTNAVMISVTAGL